MTTHVESGLDHDLGFQVAVDHGHQLESDGFDDDVRRNTFGQKFVEPSTNFEQAGRKRRSKSRIHDRLHACSLHCALVLDNQFRSPLCVVFPIRRRHLSRVPLLHQALHTRRL